MKKLFLLLAFITLTVSAQTTPPTPFDGIKLKYPQLGTVNDSIVLWNGTSKVLKYIPISAITPSLQKVTDIGNSTTQELISFDGGYRSKLTPNEVVVENGSNLDVCSLQYNQLVRFFDTGSGLFKQTLKFENPTIDHIITIPNASGTMALLSDISGSSVTSVNAQTGVVILTSDNIGDGTTYKQYSATEKTKLAGIASGATANSSDATLLARANHTGTQTASTISDFNTQVATTAALKSNNLSDLASASTARTNLGLGTLATQSGTFTAKQDNISLTTTGSSGAATFVSNTLNVPNYTLSGLGGQMQLNGTGFVKASGTTISYDNSTYLTTSTAASTYAPISTTPIILLNDNTTTSAVTGTTSNTILNSYLVPSNTFASGDRLIVNFLALKSTAVGTATYRLYINTTNSLSGATQVATFANATGSKFQLMERNLSFKSSTSLEVFSSTVGNAYDLGTDTNLPSTITYDTTQAYYLITSVIPTSASDSFTQSRLSITKFKSKTTF